MSVMGGTQEHFLGSEHGGMSMLRNIWGNGELLD